MKTILLLFVALMLSLPALGQELLDVTQKREVLRTLLLENREKYKEALESWNSMKGSSEGLHFRTYIDLLELGRQPIPETNKDLKFGFRYAIWQKDFKELHYLLKRPFIDPQNDAIRLQMAYVALLDQDYKEALLLLSVGKPKKLGDQQMQSSLLIVYYLLQGRKELAKVSLQQYKKASLYVYPGYIAPLLEKADSSFWERSAMHYPEDKYVEEQLFFAYLQQNKEDWVHWPIPEKQAWWKGYPALASGRIQFQEALEYLGSKESSLQDFNRWVEYLDGKHQKTKLKLLCTLWQERYPYLEDGKLCMQLAVTL